MVTLHTHTRTHTHTHTHTKRQKDRVWRYKEIIERAGQNFGKKRDFKMKGDATQTHTHTHTQTKELRTIWSGRNHVRLMHTQVVCNVA